MTYTTRIAPSPTGLFHIGTARTAYHNYLAAKASGGTFILRIDDTDEARNTPENVNTILRGMEWLGLEYEGPYYQSRMHREGIYRAHVDTLLGAGLAAKDDEGYIRLSLPDSTEFLGTENSWQDTIAGELRISKEAYDHARNLTLVRPNGMPVYHLATVVDDLHLGVNYVMRGTDHLSNAPKHELIRRALQKAYNIEKAPALTYTHVGLITLGTKKISKREPDHAKVASLQTYIDEGIHRDAFLNFILRMGWGPRPDDKTTVVIPRDRARELFLAGRLKNSPARLDLDKLRGYDTLYKAGVQA